MRSRIRPERKMSCVSPGVATLPVGTRVCFPGSGNTAGGNSLVQPLTDHSGSDAFRRRQNVSLRWRRNTSGGMIHWKPRYHNLVSRGSWLKYYKFSCYKFRLTCVFRECNVVSLEGKLREISKEKPVRQRISTGAGCFPRRPNKGAAVLLSLVWQRIPQRSYPSMEYHRKLYPFVEHAYLIQAIVSSPPRKTSRT